MKSITVKNMNQLIIGEFEFSYSPLILVVKLAFSFFQVKFIYRLPPFMCLLIFSLRKCVEKTFEYFIFSVISRKVKTSLARPENVENLIRTFKGKFETKHSSVLLIN